MNLSSVSGHNRPTGSAPAVLLCDATCRFCTASGKRTVAFMPRGSVVLRDINDPAAQTRYGVTPEAAARDMHLVTRRGTLLVGADAVRGLLHLTRWGRPLSYLWL